MAALFSRLDPHVQRVSGWLTIGGAILSTIFTGLAKAAPLFHDLNWAGAILVGVALALGTMLGLALILVVVGYGFRFFRPHPATAPLDLDYQPGQIAEQLEATEQIRGQIAELRDRADKASETTRHVNSLIQNQAELKNSLTEEIVGTQQRVEGLEAANAENKAGLEAALATLSSVQKFALDEMKELREKLAEHKDHMAKCYSDQDAARLANVDALRREMASQFVAALDAINKVQDRAEKTEQWIKSISDELRQRFGNLDDAFAATGNREKSDRLFRELGEDFDALAAPIDAGIGISDWSAWLRDSKNWRGKLDEWLLIADHYASGITDAVLAQPEHIYDQVQVNEDGLNATQVHRFKELTIWWHNAQAGKPQVDKAIKRSVFSAPSMKGRPDPPPDLSLMDITV